MMHLKLPYGLIATPKAGVTHLSKTSVMTMGDTYSRLSGENSIGYALTAHAVACETCMFSHGEPPYADLPGKANCQVFTYESGLVKPEDVYFHGADCPYHSDNF